MSDASDISETSEKNLKKRNIDDVNNVDVQQMEDLLPYEHNESDVTEIFRKFVKLKKKNNLSNNFFEVIESSVDANTCTSLMLDFARQTNEAIQKYPKENKDAVQKMTAYIGSDIINYNSSRKKTNKFTTKTLSASVDSIMNLKPVKTSEGLHLGEWRNGQPYGPGKLTRNNGTYRGNFLSLKEIDGVGTIKYVNGDFYKGEIFNYEMTGKGTLKTRSYTYNGNLLRDLQHGEGIITTNNMKIIGKWEKDQPLQNVFNITYMSQVNKGDVYIGQINDLFEKQGSGKYTTNNGLIFQGTWKDDVLTYGTFTDANNNNNYIGDFELSDGCIKPTFTNCKALINGNMINNNSGENAITINFPNGECKLLSDNDLHIISDELLRNYNYPIYADKLQSSNLC